MIKCDYDSICAAFLARDVTDDKLFDDMMREIMASLDSSMREDTEALAFEISPFELHPKHGVVPKRITQMLAADLVSRGLTVESHDQIDHNSRIVAVSKDAVATFAANLRFGDQGRKDTIKESLFR